MKSTSMFLFCAFIIAILLPSYLLAVEITVVGNSTGYSKSFLEGVNLAVDEQNEQGGIQGNKINVNFFDDQGKPEYAVSIAKQIASKKNDLLGVVGHSSSRTTLAAAPIYNINGIPLIVPTAQSPTITEGKMQNIFRIGGRTDWMAEFLAITLRDNLSWRSGILLYPKYFDSKLADILKIFSIKKLQILYKDVFTMANIVKALDMLNKMPNSGLIVFYPSEKQVQKIIVKTTEGNVDANILIATEFSGSSISYKKLAKEFGKSLFFLSPIGPDSYPDIKDVFDRSNALSNFALYPYLATRILIDTAINIHKDKVDHKSMINYLREKTFSTPVGDINFNNNGDARWAAYAVYSLNNKGIISPVKFDGSGGSKDCCPGSSWCCP